MRTSYTRPTYFVIFLTPPVAYRDEITMLWWFIPFKFPSKYTTPPPPPPPFVVCRFDAVPLSLYERKLTPPSWIRQTMALNLMENAIIERRAHKQTQKAIERLLVTRIRDLWWNDVFSTARTAVKKQRRKKNKVLTASLKRPSPRLICFYLFLRCRYAVAI